MGGSSSTFKNSLVELKNLNDSVYIFHDPGRHKEKIFIFFHDILWPGFENAYVQTWMSSGNPSVCWPKDWLSTRYPKAQILSVRYNAKLQKQRNTGHIDIEILAESLWQDILLVCERNNFPIFLIGHGLGGIVIKEIIRAMQRQRDNLNSCKTTCNDLEDREIDRLDCFLKNVKGVFYYSTPCHGIRLVNFINFPCKSPLAELLEVLSPYICRLNEDFRKWRSSRSCKATAIYPLLPTKMTFWYGQRWTVVVDEAAARCDTNGFYPAKGSDYFTVCKPKNDTDSSFQILIEFFSSGVPAITEEPRAHIEDTQSRRKCIKYVQDTLSALPNLDGLKLNMFDLEQLWKFEDLSSKLTNGLKEAGFKKRGNDGNSEQWELIRRKT